MSQILLRTPGPCHVTRVVKNYIVTASGGCTYSTEEHSTHHEDVLCNGNTVRGKQAVDRDDLVVHGLEEELIRRRLWAISKGLGSCMFHQQASHSWCAY